MGMNKSVLIAVAFLSFNCAGQDFDQFCKILSKLESNDNDYALGDNGKALGRYQIWESYYQDARVFDKTISFPYYSLTNKVNSEKVIKAYLERYCKGNRTWEDMARCHNSGPSWKKKKHLTDKYIKKFLAISKQIR